MKDFSLLLLFLSSIFIIQPYNCAAVNSYEVQITRELDSIRFHKYLDDSDSSIALFYKDSALFYGKEIDSLLDTKLCVDSLHKEVKERYKPYSWGAAATISGGIFNVLGVAGVLIANEKMDYKELDSLTLVDKCTSEKIRAEQQKVRFRYTTYGAIVGILLNGLYVYYQLKD